MNMLTMLLLMGGRGLRMGGGLLKKVLIWTMTGGSPLAFLMGGFSVKDFLLIPMIAPMFAGMFGGGAAAPAAGTPLA